MVRERERKATACAVVARPTGAWACVGVGLVSMPGIVRGTALTFFYNLFLVQLCFVTRETRPSITLRIPRRMGRTMLHSSAAFRDVSMRAGGPI